MSSYRQISDSVAEGRFLCKLTWKHLYLSTSLPTDEAK